MVRMVSGFLFHSSFISWWEAWYIFAFIMNNQLENFSIFPRFIKLKFNIVRNLYNKAEAEKQSKRKKNMNEVFKSTIWLDDVLF